MSVYSDVSENVYGILHTGDISGNDASFNVVDVSNIFMSSMSAGPQGQIGNVHATLTAAFVNALAAQSQASTLAGGNITAKVNRSGDTMTGALVLESDLSGVDASFNDVSANMFYGDISGLVQVTDVGNAGIQYLLFTEQSGVPAGLGSLS